jgi:hypothetical protein
MKQLILGLSLLSAAFGQTITPTANVVTAVAGANVTITETLVADGRSVASYQAELSAGNVVSCTTPVVGKSAILNPANKRAMVAGYTPPTLNSTLLANGPTMVCVVTIPANTPAGNLTIGLNAIVASDALGNPVMVSAGLPVTILVTLPNVVGDLNADGRVDAADVGIAITQALGTAACNSGDVNGDGKCDVRDVQFVIHAAGF